MKTYSVQKINMEKLHNFLHDINLFLHGLKEIPKHLQIFFPTYQANEFILYFRVRKQRKLRIKLSWNNLTSIH